MLNINLERPLVTLAVVAGLLAVAGPASASRTDTASELRADVKSDYVAQPDASKWELNGFDAQTPTRVTGVGMLPYIEQDNYQTGGPGDETATPALKVPGRVEYPNLTNHPAPGNERHPGDQLVFSGDAYDNEMGITGASENVATCSLQSLPPTTSCLGPHDLRLLGRRAR